MREKPDTLTGTRRIIEPFIFKKDLIVASLPQHLERTNKKNSAETIVIVVSQAVLSF
jgi:hypothetical protein